MGLADTYVLGRNTEACVNLEPAGSFATYVQPTAASSMRLLSGMIKADEERKDRLDARQSRSLLERIKGRLSVEWEMSTYMLPISGADNTPDIDPLLAIGFGVASGTSPRAYSMSASQSLPGSASATLAWNDTFMLGARGMVCEEMVWNVPGGEEPTIDFSGKAVDFIKTAYFTHDGTAPAAATTITPTPVTDNYKVDVGSRLQIGTETVPSIVSNVNRTTGLITFAPALTGSQAANTDCIPSSPFDEAQTGGSPIPAVLGQIDIGTKTDVLIANFTMSVKNNWKEIKEAAFKRVVQDFIPGFREVSGEVTMWARRTDLEHWAWAQSANTENPTNFSVQIGSLTTGDAQILLTLPNVEFDFSELNPQGDEPAQFTVPYKAMATTNTAEDEVSASFRNAP